MYYIVCFPLGYSGYKRGTPQYTRIASFPWGKKLYNHFSRGGGGVARGKAHNLPRTLQHNNKCFMEVEKKILYKIIINALRRLRKKCGAYFKT